MAIYIQHTYTTTVQVTYRERDTDREFRRNSCGSMDEIAEMVVEDLVKHNFSSADVCSNETGEHLMINERKEAV